MSYLNWSYIQERISSTDYSKTSLSSSSLRNRDETIIQTEARWTFVIVLNFCMAAMCSIISIPFVLLDNGEEAPTKGKLQKRIQPDTSLALPAISQTLASPFGFFSLFYINYPMLLLMKSSKLMPVMFVSYFLNRKRYTKSEIVGVILISSGIALFSCIIHPMSLLFDADKKNVFRLEQQYDNPILQTLIGFGLVSINLLMDGITNAYQDKYRNSNPQISPFFMMYHINLWQSILLFTYLLCTSMLKWLVPEWISIGSQLEEAFFFMKQYPSVINDVVWFSLFGATGQIFIFNIIMSFGSLVSVKICLTRKFFSTLISILVFGHTVHWWQWMGVVIVFSGLSLTLIDEKKMIYMMKAKTKTTTTKLL